MISKVELGRRIRESRLQKGMTLKQLDQLSGFSATHISEIERGKTSPTIGALLRVAAALGKEPSYFIEEELLPEIALTARDQREGLPAGYGEGEILTPGIPGGRLHAYTFRLKPGNPPLRLSRIDGEEGGLVIGGSIRAMIDGKSYDLTEGDAIHHGSEVERTFEAMGEEPAELILLTTWRLRAAASAVSQDTRTVPATLSEAAGPPEAASESE